MPNEDLDGDGEYYDRSGARIGLRAWAALWNDDDYRTVERTDVGRVTVITAWFGHDLQGRFDRQPPPIFGTITRFNDGSGLWGHEDEWITEAEARVGHAARVAEEELKTQ